MSDALRTNYERIAALYDIDRAHWRINADKVVEALVVDGASHVRVLDVGCGTGLYLTAQREHFPSAPVTWFGVDASEQMLSAAAQKASDLPLSRAHAEALPMRSGTIDYVYSSFAFHHFTDKDAALDEMARVLRPDGRLRIRNMDPWGQPKWWLYEFFPGTWNTDERRFWHAERITAALERRGFEADAVVDREQRTSDLYQT